MNRRILGLAGVHAVAGIVLLLVVPAGGPGAATGTTLGEVVGFTVLFTVVGFLPIHLEFRRNAFSVVLDEAVWILALFAMEPAAVVGCAIVADAASRLTRQPPIKSIYNLASMFLAASIGVTIFAALQPPAPGDPRAWLAAILAMGALSGSSLVSISMVLAMVEGRALRHVLLASTPSQLVATGANASLGLATVVLLDSNPLGPLLLAPLVGAAVVGSRRQALQAAQHLRFERLYAAAARTGGLTRFDDALVTLAGEARALVTGSVAMCCARRGDDDWLGVRVDDHGHGPADRAAVAALVELARTGTTHAVDLSSIPESASRALPSGVDLVVAAPAPSGKGQIVLGVSREITPDEQSQGRVEVLAAFAGYAALVAENARLYEEVDDALRRQIDLNRQKSEFVAAVSHELRTPLTTVLAAISSVLRLNGRIEPAMRDQVLGRALDQGNRLRLLIEDLLVVAATEHGAVAALWSPVDVGQVASEVVAELHHRSGGRLQLQLAPHVGPIQSDGEKVRRIITNLIDNAVKYASDGPIEVRVCPAEAALEIAVSDHGPGIPRSHREHVFEPFVQLDQSSTRRRGGTGLGLHLCRQLAELLGGRLELDEAPGGGCRFTLRLPDMAGGAGRETRRSMAQRDRPQDAQLVHHS